MTAMDDSGAAAREAADPDGGGAGTVMDGMQRLSLAAWPAQRTPTAQLQQSPAARAFTCSESCDMQFGRLNAAWLK